MARLPHQVKMMKIELQVTALPPGHHHVPLHILALVPEAVLIGDVCPEVMRWLRMGQRWGIESAVQADCQIGFYIWPYDPSMAN